MEKSKSVDEFYVPTIEEFHVGFEYERNDGSDWYNKVSNAYDMMDVSTMLNKQKEYEMYESHPKNIDLTESERDEKLKEIRLQKNVYCKRIRVKYLDREDIEAEGFKKVGDQFDSIKTYFGVGTGDDKKLCVYLDEIDHSIDIWYRSNRGDLFTKFEGIVKNKSEFKKLLKMLRIND